LVILFGLTVLPTIWTKLFHQVLLNQELFMLVGYKEMILADCKVFLRQTKAVERIVLVSKLMIQ